MSIIGRPKCGPAHHRAPLVLLLLLGSLVIVGGHQPLDETCDLSQKCAAAAADADADVGVADENIAGRHANYYTPETNQPPASKQNHEPIAPSDHQCHFRAAVVEYNRRDLPDCHESAHFNLNNLEAAARLAAQNGSQLVVFPEDAIVWAAQLSASLRACLEEIPEPEPGQAANPCLQTGEFGNFTILTRLSCLARDLNVYIVANFGTRETCDIQTDTKCPQDNFRALNTNVVLDPQGNYIARYRKYNPFVEVFAKAPRLEHVHFDTPFGRFGVFTCFDIIFRQPAVELVERFNINTAIFPTWWYDELPMLSALQFQDAWSARHRVNLLASNILKPSLGSTGSSIFAAHDSVYVGAPNKQSKVIIASLPRPDSSLRPECAQANQFAPVVLNLPSAEADETYTFKNYAMSDEVFPLSANATVTTVCARRICCRLQVEFNGKPAEGRLVLLVRDARRRGRFPWAEQVCFVATLSEKLETGKPLSFSQTHLPGLSFESLSLEAHFDTEYVYPIAAHNVSRLLERTRRDFRCFELNETGGAGREPKRRHKCQLSLTENNPERVQLYSFGMYGRVYDEDGQAREDVDDETEQPAGR